MRQRGQKRRHQGDFNRHEKRRNHIGGNHLRPLRQRRHQRLGDKRIKRLGKRDDGKKSGQHHQHNPHQTPAQFDQMFNQGLGLLCHLNLADITVNPL